ncbi:MAG: VCBS domain-containing protein, partial [Actinobacteria bacterium]|nr:VCBS domain-containing protein [Actinomycetota bacterium]
SVDPANNAFDYLALTESTEVVVSYTISDGNGGNVSQTATVTISGTNDDPAISFMAGNDAGTLTEGSVLSDSGTISFADVDLSDRPTGGFTVTSVSAEKADLSELTLSGAQQAAIEGGFDLPAVSGNTNNGTVDWDYTISEGDLNFLAVGEKVTAIFTVTVDDGNGGTVNQDVTVTISGTNDDPQITTSATQSVDENSPFSLALTATDPDGPSTTSFSITGGDDLGKFSLDTSGVLSMAAQDYETPLDVGGNNTYEVEVSAFDGSVYTPQLIIVTVNDVDEISPKVNDVSAAYSTITEANVGTGTFSITVVFNEEMSTSATPTLLFSNETDVLNTITFNSGSWSITKETNDTYTATYDVDDVNANLADIIVDVENAQDKTGNDQLDYSASAEFSIDTTAPNAPTVDLLTNSADTSDTITNINPPTVRINLDMSGSAYSKPANGDTLRLYADGIAICTAIILTDTDLAYGYVDITTALLGDDDHNLTATITDQVGNIGESPVLPITIDTKDPDAPTLSLNTINENIDGTFNMVAETDAHVQYRVSSDNGTAYSVWTDWEPTPPSFSAAAVITDYIYEVHQTDVAGNLSA